MAKRRNKKRKKKDTLSALADIGLRMGNAPLLINNNAVKALTGKYNIHVWGKKSSLPPLAEFIKKEKIKK